MYTQAGDKIRTIIGAERTNELPQIVTHNGRTYQLDGTGKWFPTPMDAWNLYDVHPYEDFVCYAYYIPQREHQTEQNSPASMIEAGEIERHLLALRGASKIGKLETRGWGETSKPVVYVVRGTKAYDAIACIVDSNLHFEYDKDKKYQRFQIPRELIPAVAVALEPFVN